MYGKIINNVLVSAPENYTLGDGRIIANFNQDVTSMLKYGFKLVHETIPSYDANRETIYIKSYTSDETNLYVIYGVIPKPMDGNPGGGGNVNVIDNLDSTDTKSALSANQGRVLNEKIASIKTGGWETFPGIIEEIGNINTIIDELRINKADINFLNVLTAQIQNLTVNKADINELNAIYARIDTLDVENLNALVARINELKADIAIIGDLTALNATINKLKADYAEITTLVNGHLTSDNIQSLIISGDKFTVANGFIKNAMIESVNASKILTGELDTNLVKILSSDGSLSMVGTLLQFKDENNKVRIQMGKDAQGKFTFMVLDETGTGTIMDSNGITQRAIGNGLIVNDMISDGAISGGKINISSLFTEINKSTSTIKASKIKFDDSAQTLEVAFNQMKTTVSTLQKISEDGNLDSIVEQVDTNTTAIGIAQGKIDTLISNTTIIKENGTTQSIKDAYSALNQTVSSLSTTVGQHTTNYNTLNGKVETVTSNLTKVTQDVAGVKTSVSSLQKNITDNYSTTAQMDTAIATTASGIRTSITSLQQTLQNNYSTTTQMNTIINNTASGIQTSISSLQQTLQSNYSTTTQMNTAIKASADGIQSTVSSQYVTKNTHNNDLTTVNSSISTVSQKANKIDWLITSGSTSSSLSLTQNALNAIAQNITLTANKINLHGLVTANNNFKILSDGSIEAKNAKFSGDITGATFTSRNEVFKVLDDGSVETSYLNVGEELSTDVLNVSSISNPAYPSVLTRNCTVYISPSYTDAEEFEHGARYSSIKSALRACPRDLNLYTLTINLDANITENVEFNNKSNGHVILNLNNKTIKGYVYCTGLSMRYRIYGNSSSNNGTSSGYGSIMPNQGYSADSSYFSITNTCCGMVKIYDLKVYAGFATNNNHGIYNIEANMFASNIQFINCDIAVRASTTSRVAVRSSQGLTNSYAFSATSGSIICLDGGTQVGRRASTTHTYASGGSQIFKDSDTVFSTSGVGGSNDNTAPAPKTNTVTLTSDYGDTYRRTVYNNWKKDGTVRQGEWGEYGDCVGCWFFGSDIYDIIQNSSNTVTSVTIKITRQTGNGNYGDVTHTLRLHTYGSRPSGSPGFVDSSIFSRNFALACGNSITITLTSAQISALKSSKAKGFGLYPTSFNGTYYSVCSGKATVTIKYTTT